MYYEIILPSERLWHKSEGLTDKFISIYTFSISKFSILLSFMKLWLSIYFSSIPWQPANASWMLSQRVTCVCVLYQGNSMEMLFIQVRFYLLLVYVHLTQSCKSKCKRSQTMAQVRLRFWMEQEILLWFLGCHFFLGSGTKIGIVANT